MNEELNRKNDSEITVEYTLFASRALREKDLTTTKLFLCGGVCTYACGIHNLEGL